MLTLTNIMDNPVMSRLELKVENANLNRNIVNVCVLDYEFDKKHATDIVFYKDEFILSSLQIAKNNDDLFYEIIEKLIKLDVCGIAIKNVYYKEIPTTVLELASEHNFPIFIFDEATYYEDIIIAVMQELEGINKDSIYKRVFDRILKNHYSTKEAFELLKIKPDTYSLFIVKSDKKQSVELFSSSRLAIETFNYNNCLIIFFKKDFNCEYHLNYLYDILDGDYYIGTSTLEDDFSKSLINAFNSLRAAIYKNKKYDEDFGKDYMSLLIESYQNEQYQNFMNNYLANIINDKTMMKTLIAYIKFEGDFTKCSKYIHSHENTLRYRIEKAKSLIDSSSSKHQFNVNLTLAITIYNLNQFNFNI